VHLRNGNAITPTTSPSHGLAHQPHLADLRHVFAYPLSKRQLNNVINESKMLVRYHVAASSPNFNGDAKAEAMFIKYGNDRIKEGNSLMTRSEFLLKAFNDAMGISSVFLFINLTT
jgi:hypothetical protein